MDPFIYLKRNSLVAWRVQSNQSIRDGAGGSWVGLLWWHLRLKWVENKCIKHTKYVQLSAYIKGHSRNTGSYPKSHRIQAFESLDAITPQARPSHPYIESLPTLILLNLTYNGSIYIPQKEQSRGVEGSEQPIDQRWGWGVLGWAVVVAFEDAFEVEVGRKQVYQAHKICAIICLLQEH